MTLEEFNSKYKYKSDKEKFGFAEVWELPKISKDGYVYGDCESYCRFLKNKVARFKDWDYYYCKVSGEGHCVLYKNGDVIDCNHKRIITLEQYIANGKIADFRKYGLFTVISKIVIGKVLTWIK